MEESCAARMCSILSVGTFAGRLPIPLVDTDTNADVNSDICRDVGFGCALGSIDVDASEGFGADAKFGAIAYVAADDCSDAARVAAGDGSGVACVAADDGSDVVELSDSDSGGGRIICRPG